MSAPNDRYLQGGSRDADRGGRDRHRRPRVHRHAGPAPGQAAARALLPRRRARARHRGLQLPARRRHRHEHRRRLRDLVVGAGVRRHGVRPRLGHAPAAPPPARRPRWCSATWSGSTTRRCVQSPRTMLQAAARPGRRARHGGAGRHRAGVHRVRHHLRGRPPTSATATSTPVNQYNVDYSILGTTRVEPLLRDIRNHIVRRGHGRRGRQGRVQLRPARDRLPLRRRAGHRRQPQRLQDDGQGDRRPAGQGRSRSWRSTTSARATPATSTCRCAASDGDVVFWDGERDARRSTTSSSPACSRRCADFTLLYAPNINSYKRFAAGSFAPTTIAWGTGQPHLRGPAGRPRARAPGWRTASPAATSTPTSRWPRCSPAACTASRTS